MTRETVLDETTLDETILDETILDETILDGATLNSFDIHTAEGSAQSISEVEPLNASTQSRNFIQPNESFSLQSSPYESLFEFDNGNLVSGACMNGGVAHDDLYSNISVTSSKSRSRRHFHMASHTQDYELELSSALRGTYIGK